MKIKEIKSIKKFGVHDGVFHADDIFCCALVRLINSNVEIVRTRNKVILDTCDIIADVGGGSYDHHSTTKIYHRNGVPMSGVSLLFQDYYEELIDSVLTNYVENYNQDDHKKYFKAIASTLSCVLLKGIDASDNGCDYIKKSSTDLKIPATVTSIISSYCPMKVDMLEEQFYKAVNFAEHVLRSSIIAVYDYLVDNDNQSPTRTFLNKREILEIFDTNNHTDMIHIMCTIDEVFVEGLTYEDTLCRRFGQFTAFTLYDLEDDVTTRAISKAFNDVKLGFYDTHMRFKTANIELKTLYNKMYISCAYDMFGILRLPFKEKLALVEEYLLNASVTKLLKSDVVIGDVLTNAVNKALWTHQKYIELPQYLPWHSTVLNLTETLPLEERILYVIYPSLDNEEYRVACVPKSSETRESLAPFPTEWRGLRDSELANVTGIKSAIFCHDSGFLIGTGTHEDALKVIEVLNI